MIRVAHVKSNYGQVGGIESMLEGLMPEFAALSDIETLIVFVSHQRDQGLEARLSGQGRVRVIHLPWTGLAQAPARARTLTRILQNERIDVLHTHDMRANLLAAMSRTMRPTPWLCHIHGWLGPTHSRLFRAFEAVDRALMRRADHVLVGSSATLAEVQAAGARVASLVPNAVPLPPLAQKAKARVDLGLPSEGVVFSVLGRLHPGKGQDLFLQALACLPRQADWSAVVVGAGDQDAPLQALSEKLQLTNRVRFTGFVESTAPWIAASDVIAVPSRKESLPLTCLEGMAQGRAVVVSQAGDLPRVVAHGQTGLIVPIDDAPALAKAFARLLADPEERLHFGQAARDYITTHHSVAALAAQIAAIQAQVAAQSFRSV